MRSYFSLNSGVLALCLLSLSACGGGGGSDSSGGGVSNRAPTASAGADRSVDEFDAITLDGTGSSDPDGDTLTYAWTQTGGAGVTISNATSASAGFDAPDVTALDTPVTLTFQLTVRDATVSDTDTVSITVNDAGLGANSAPIANAGSDQSVLELTTVTLDATGSSDPDGDTVTYTWLQTSGPAVVLSDANDPQASFDAPASPATLVFQLTADDGSDSATDSVEITVSAALSAVSISGKLFYELPTRKNDFCRGYDFSAIQNKPVRLAVVQLVDDASPTPNVIETVQSGLDGSYTFANVATNTNVAVRVITHLQESGVQNWDVYVRDNTSNTTQPFTSRPMYAIEMGAFNTGTNNIANQDFVATTGWGGASYTGQRAAAPLAIMDALLDGVLLVASVDNNVDMGRLDAFWSVNNSWVDDPEADTAAEIIANINDGRLRTTYYSSNPDYDGIRNPSLFLLGDAVGRFPGETVQVDTDEFDRGVIIHEWGHFFEDELSRSDSIGGRHVIPGTVEPRVAFGEGWGYGISGIAGGDPVLCDTGAPATTGSGLNVETWLGYGSRGFFNEMSVAHILYDLFDATNEGGGDSGSTGFGPIYETMTQEQRNTDSFTTIFSFATHLKGRVDATGDTLVDSLLDRERIDTAPLDIWGSGQSRIPSGSQDFIPVYTDIPSGGAPVQVCVNNEYDEDSDGNKPGVWRYLSFTTSSNSAWRIAATATQTATGYTSDPDFYLFRRNNWLNYCSTNAECQTVGSGVTGAADTETLDTDVLASGTYIIAFEDWRLADPDYTRPTPPDFDRSCFDITRNPL